MSKEFPLCTDILLVTLILRIFDLKFEKEKREKKKKKEKKRKGKNGRNVRRLTEI